MDTTAGTSKLVENERRYQFIPVRKEDLFSTLIKTISDRTAANGIRSRSLSVCFPNSC
jgi:hypothetical protein